MLTPLKAETFNNIQIDAGVFVTGVDPSESATLDAFETAILTAMNSPATCLGATRGGGTFKVTKETREIEADGKRYSFVGSTVIDSQDPSIATTLLEVTPGNLEKLLVTADAKATGERTTITPRNDIEDADYIDCLTWVGETRNGFMVIVLENAINKSDATITINDKGEATLAVEFHGTAGSVSSNKPPYMLYRYEPQAQQGS